MAENFLNINLTQTQFAVLCVVFMLICFVSIGYLFMRFLLKAISQVNVQGEKNEQKEKTCTQKKSEKKSADFKKGIALIFSVFCVFGVMDYFTDSIPGAFKISSKLGVSPSLFFLLIAGVGMFLVLFYIPYKILKIVMAHVKMEDVDSEKENSK